MPSNSAHSVMGNSVIAGFAPQLILLCNKVWRQFRLLSPLNSWGKSGPIQYFNDSKTRKWIGLNLKAKECTELIKTVHYKWKLKINSAYNLPVIVLFFESEAWRLRLREVPIAAGTCFK